MSALAVAGGLWLQATRPQLPAAYTWLQPFSSFHWAWSLPGVPLAVALAAVAGRLARPSPLRSLSRRTWLFAGLAAVALAALDTVTSPRHGVLDALAVMLLVGVLARRWSLWRWRSVTSQVLVSALVFTAGAYWFTVAKALVFVGGVPLDASIVNFEQWFTGQPLHREVAAWAAQQPTWVSVFDWAYSHLIQHVIVTSAFLFALRDRRQRTEFFAAMTFCYLLGAPLYWLYPAVGPVYFDPGAFAFLHDQSLGVNWLQSYLLRNTSAVNHGTASTLVTWGYIACMPSLHVAQELVMLYAVRRSRVAFLVSLAFLAITMVGVVALGWHYPTDVVFGLLLGGGVIGLARWTSAWLLPRRAAPPSLAPLPVLVPVAVALP